MARNKNNAQIKKPKRKRVYNTRLIKATWPYTVQEIAALFKVHKNAPLRWLKEGLRADREKREYLIRGNELARFLSERQRKKKHKCKPNQFYCFKCRTPRMAYLNIADVAIESANRLRVKAICCECGTSISKVQNIKKLPEIQNTFHVQQIDGQRIMERDENSLNSDSRCQT